MKRTIFRLLIITAAAFLIGSVSYAQPEKAKDIIPVGSGKMSLDLKGMDVVEVLKMLAIKGNLNIVIGSGVQGRVTMFLKDVDIKDALEIVLLSGNLACDKRDSVIYVMTGKDYESMYGEKYADNKVVKIFQFKFAKAVEAAKALNQLKSKIGKIVVDEGSNTIVVIDSTMACAQVQDTIERIDMPTATKIFELKYAKVADLKTKVQESLTKGVGTMQIDERTNKIVVQDLEKKMGEIEGMMKAFDDKLQQVLIEAKIVQITLDDKYKLGVDWEQVLKKLEKEISIKTTFEIATMNTLTPGAQIVIGTLGSSADYAAMLQALKTIGDANLLSSPRISALNNQEAKILVGTSQPYATNTVTQGTSTTTTATNLTFIDVGVKLFVTPTINKDGFVTMKIKPEVSSVSGTYTYGSPATTVPIVSTTQAETSVTVKDGMTIIIAGLIKDERTSTVDKVPILGDIPLIGELFRKTDKETKKQELVVFLTPHVITGEGDYLEQPQGPPVGEKRFTISEKPAFERRDAFDMKPSYFKERRKKTVTPKKKDEGEPAKKAKNKIEIKKRAVIATPEEYYYHVKEKIAQNMELPKEKTQIPYRGTVKMAFFLSPNGGLIYRPEILESSNHVLDGPAMEAVCKASPFPPFPESMEKLEKRFIIDFSFE